MKKFVVILAGGKGLRMGSAIPKQFLKINGKAIILHTLEKFKKALPTAELFLVLPESELNRWKDVAKGTDFQGIKIAIGGKTRFDSVKAGLQLIEEFGLVAIHDSVRPLVSEEAIISTFEEAENSGAAIPVMPLKDSLRQVDRASSAAVNREEYRIVQTPQVFNSELLSKAYQQDFLETFTDDASVVEAYGTKVSLVKGNYSNIKITTVEDLKIAEFLLKE